jgi:phosphoribosylformylglycinamidine cyclo-ligase
LSSNAYRAAGVDIDAKSRLIDGMHQTVRSTYGPEVLAGIGAFGGLYDAAGLKKAAAPVLVASTDGVGTKTRLGLDLDRVEGLGEDIVNHCINDILVQGAAPLFFLDYVAMPRLVPETIARIVSGCAAACREARCALIGGETAEMPGVYAPGEMDLVGTIVGWVERERIIDGSAIAPGDVAVGLASSGLHTNGYSLARRVLAGEPMTGDHPALGLPLGEALLAPHRSYLPVVNRMREVVQVKGLAHITGGGFTDNLPRILPPGIGVRLDPAAWPVPAVFRLIQEKGRVAEDEMYHVFNMGVGMVAFVAAADCQTALAAAGPGAWPIGEAVSWDGKRSRVCFRGQ